MLYALVNSYGDIKGNGDLIHDMRKIHFHRSVFTFHTTCKKNWPLGNPSTPQPNPGGSEGGNEREGGRERVWGV